MLEERYQLKLTGQLKDGADHGKAVEILSEQFRTPPNRIEQLLDGRQRIVKNGISLENAENYATVFKNVGVLTKIDIVFDSRILEDSTIPLEGVAVPLEEAHTEIETNDESRENGDNRNPVLTWKFETYFFNVLVISLPYSVSIQDDSGQASGTITSEKIAMGWFLSLFLSVFLVTTLLDSILKYQLRYALSGFLWTTGIIVLFLFMLLFFPKYIRPKKVVKIFHGTSQEF